MNSDARHPSLAFLVSLWLQLLLLLFPCTAARVIFVTPSGQDTSACGLVPSSACASLTFTLETVAHVDDEIELSSGTYVERGATIVFGASASMQKNLTIRSTTGRATDVTIDRAYHGRLFDFTGTTTTNWFVSFSGIRFYRGGWSDAMLGQDSAGALMRLTAAGAHISFTNCDFESNMNPAAGFAGRGGVGVISACSPQFTNCHFRDKWGGIAGTFYIASTATPQFENCVFENSGCHSNGWGGVLVPEEQSGGTWRHCVFRNNTYNYGGAVDDGGTATPRFLDCTFEHNFAGNMGGAYYGFGDSSSRFERCLFLGNRVAKGGNGQDYFLSSSSAPVFTDCVFDAGPNPVLVSDGASGTVKDNAELTMVRSTVKGYRVSYGTLHFSVTSSGTIDSCLFTDNKCVRGGAIATERLLLVRNTTFRNNEANEGGAIAIYGTATAKQLVRIEDSLFEANTARTSGGAIRASGSIRVEIVRTRVVQNHAIAQGGGGLYSGTDVELVVNQSSFVENASPLGGAIWSSGVTLVAVDSLFQQNTLATKTDDIDDSCGLLDGRTGGAVYVSLATSDEIAILTDTSDVTPSVGPSSSSACTLNALRLQRLLFVDNAASDGGGGALFVDGRLPACIVRASQVCIDCVFANNSASYGQDMATAVSALTMLSSAADSHTDWTLMTPRDIVLGATDRFGQRLGGSHAPIVVRINVTDAANSLVPVRLVSNTSRVLRNGVVTFKSVSLQMPPSIVTNTIDRVLTIAFTSDRSGTTTGDPIGVALAITLLKCPQSTGLLNLDGGCLVEATSSKQELTAGIILAVVASVAFGFVVYWSYTHSDRVLETIHAFVTGIGGVVVRFAFEIVDVVSDVQALVNLFLYDLTIAQPTLIRSAYVTLFALAAYPSISVLRWSVLSIHAQWKRVLARKQILAAAAFGPGITRRRSKHASFFNGIMRRASNSPEAQAETSATARAAAPVARSPNKWTPQGVLDSMRSTRKLQIHAFDTIKANAIVPSMSPSSPPCQYDTAAAVRFLDEQEKLLLVELEYQHVRTHYMKRSLARLVSEDGLLLVFNLYIYLANRDNEAFAKSRLRASLELSIVLSVLHFGSQVQNIASWLQANKVAEIVDQLERIRALRGAAESAAVIGEHP